MICEFESMYMLCHICTYIYICINQYTSYLYQVHRSEGKMGDEIPYTLNHFDKNTSIDCKTLGKMMTKTCWMKKAYNLIPP